ncbi:hypothetical protein HanIR_Chr17g0856421 [Helianthus annuus]|nr:hypothetical protein HanIR_Chr17g0856421 [Helianthus annuus]
MSAIMPFKWANNSLWVNGSVLLWCLSKIVCVIRYIELAAINVLEGFSTSSPLVLSWISVTISLALSENHLLISIVVFPLKSSFSRGMSNHLCLFLTSCHKAILAFRIYTYSLEWLRFSSTI